MPSSHPGNRSKTQHDWPDRLGNSRKKKGNPAPVSRLGATAAGRGTRNDSGLHPSHLLAREPASCCGVLSWWHPLPHTPCRDTCPCAHPARVGMPKAWAPRTVRPCAHPCAPPVVLPCTLLHTPHACTGGWEHPQLPVAPSRRQVPPLSAPPLWGHARSGPLLPTPGAGGLRLLACPVGTWGSAGDPEQGPGGLPAG